MIKKLKVLDLFSGIGGFSLGLESTGHFETIAFVENDEYCQAVLKHHFPEVPILGDIKNVTKETTRTTPDVICGGFPCQPYSVAGDQRAKDDPRHLWPEMFRLIKEHRPTWVIGENVNGLVKLGLDEVLHDLESEGYSTRTFNIQASSVGAPHQRQRLWIIGHLGDPEHNGSFASEREREVFYQSKEQKKQISLWESEGTSSASGDVANPDDKRIRSCVRGNDNDNEEKSGAGSVNRGRSKKNDERDNPSSTQNERMDVSDTDDSRNRTQKHRVNKNGKTNIQGRQEHTQSKSSRHGANVSDTNGKRLQGSRTEHELRKSKEKRKIGRSSWWDSEPNVGRVAYGVPNRVPRLRALGNTVVPQIIEKIGLAIIEAENGSKKDSRV